MSQRTVVIIGAALIVAGVAVNVGSGIAARHFAPAAMHAPAGSHLQLPRNPSGGMRPAHPPGHHNRGPLNP
jgi:hypothetical protein